MNEKSNSLNVIIGATSPMAGEFALSCAEEGIDLVLAGRNLRELEASASLLRYKYGVSVEVIHFDASVDGEARRLADLLAGHEFSAIVAFQGMMAGRDSFEEMMRVNCVSIAELFEALSDDAIKASRKPVFVAVSSVAGDRGRQSNYPYGATKSALDAYLSGLRNRLHPFGIRVVAIKPGFVRTRLTMGKVNSRSPLLAEPARVAGDIRHAIRCSGDVVYSPWFWRPIMAAIRWIPEFIFKRLKL